MKYKLLSVFYPEQDQSNIGDYIQALAAAQFLPQIDGFINREALKDYCGEESKMIMNGWFMHDASEWPPSEQIEPLFVSFHINSSVSEQLLCPEKIAYLKKHEPIGCRDTQTQEKLQSKGIEAYFSGCMTLTLGLKYHSPQKKDKIYFVDPYYITHWNVKMFFKNAKDLLCNYSAIHKISKKYPDTKKGLRKMMILTTFYREYRKLFSKETLVNAEYISQQNSYYRDTLTSDSERLKEAEQLVKKYAEARFVVTSRIHCALPCLGLGTPVLFTEDGQQAEISACRFGGLKDLFNVVEWEHDHLVLRFEHTGSVLNIQNKDIYKPFAEKLIDRCSKWISE